MQVLSALELGGPNRWADVPVLEVVLTSPPTPPAWFFDRLQTALDPLRAAPPPKPVSSSHAVVDPIATLDRTLALRPSVAEAFHALWLALQRAVGVDVCFDALTPLAGGQSLSVAQYAEGSLAKACIQVAQQHCRHALRREAPLPSIDLERLRDLADSVLLGPSTRSITRAAIARGIPVRRLNRGSLVQLGEGAHQRRIWTAETNATSEIAVAIAQDKQLTRQLLAAVGVPVPQGRCVADAEEAWAVASEIGLPVAVKPCDANHARGVSLNLSTRDEVLAAYEFARRDGETDDVMVEHFIRGDQHRLLVVAGKMVAAARGESEYVVGDGVHSIEQLVAAINRDPRRGENYTDPLSVLKLDESALLQMRQQQLSPESVLAAGQRALVQRIGDLTTDCTDEVHPAVAAAAVLSARTVGLDIAGVDLVAEDIGRPLAKQAGAVVEVNAGPSLSMHLAPLHGKGRPVDKAIVDSMFAPGTDGRIPIFGVAGSGPRGAVAERLAGNLTPAFASVGLAVSREEEGAWANEAYSSAERLALHPDHEVMVFECVPGRALVRGLEYPRCDTLIVTHDRCAGENRAMVQATEIALRALPRSGTLVIAADVPQRAAWLRRHTGKKIVYAFASGALSSADRRRSTTCMTLHGSQLRIEHLGRIESFEVEDPAPPQQWLPALAAWWGHCPSLDGLQSLLLARPPQRLHAAPPVLQ